MLTVIFRRKKKYEVRVDDSSIVNEHSSHSPPDQRTQNKHYEESSETLGNVAKKKSWLPLSSKSILTCPLYLSDQISQRVLHSYNKLSPYLIGKKNPAVAVLINSVSSEESLKKCGRIFLRISYNEPQAVVVFLKDSTVVRKCIPYLKLVFFTFVEKATPAVQTFLSDAFVDREELRNIDPDLHDSIYHAVSSVVSSVSPAFTVLFDNKGQVLALLHNLYSKSVPCIDFIAYQSAPLLLLGCEELKRILQDPEIRNFCKQLFFKLSNLLNENKAVIYTSVNLILSELQRIFYSVLLTLHAHSDIIVFILKILSKNLPVLISFLISVVRVEYHVGLILSKFVLAHYSKLLPVLTKLSNILCMHLTFISSLIWKYVSHNWPYAWNLIEIISKHLYEYCKAKWPVLFPALLSVLVVSWSNYQSIHPYTYDICSNLVIQLYTSLSKITPKMWVLVKETSHTVKPSIYLLLHISKIVFGEICPLIKILAEEITRCSVSGAYTISPVAKSAVNEVIPALLHAYCIVASDVYDGFCVVSPSFVSAVKIVSPVLWSAVEEIGVTCSVAYQEVKPELYSATQIFTSAIFEAMLVIMHDSYSAAVEVNRELYRALNVVLPVLWKSSQEVAPVIWRAIREIETASVCSALDVSKTAGMAMIEINRVIMSANFEVASTLQNGLMEVSTDVLNGYCEIGRTNLVSLLQVGSVLPAASKEFFADIIAGISEIYSFFYVMYILKSLKRKRTSEISLEKTSKHEPLTEPERLSLPRGNSFHDVAPECKKSSDTLLKLLPKKQSDSVVLMNSEEFNLPESTFHSRDNEVAKGKITLSESFSENKSVVHLPKRSLPPNFFLSTDTKVQKSIDVLTLSVQAAVAGKIRAYARKEVDLSIIYGINVNLMKCYKIVEPIMQTSFVKFCGYLNTFICDEHLEILFFYQHSLEIYSRVSDNVPYIRSNANNILSLLYKFILDENYKLWTLNCKLCYYTWLTTCSANDKYWAILRNVSKKLWTLCEAVAPEVWNILCIVAPVAWKAFCDISRELWNFVKSVSPIFWQSVCEISPKVWEFVVVIISNVWKLVCRLSPLFWEAFCEISRMYWLFLLSLYPVIWKSFLKLSPYIWKTLCKLSRELWADFIVVNYVLWTDSCTLCSESWKCLHLLTTNSWNLSNSSVFILQSFLEKYSPTIYGLFHELIASSWIIFCSTSLLFVVTYDCSFDVFDPSVLLCYNQLQTCKSSEIFRENKNQYTYKALQIVLFVMEKATRLGIVFKSSKTAVQSYRQALNVRNLTSIGKRKLWSVGMKRINALTSKYEAFSNRVIDASNVFSNFSSKSLSLLDKTFVTLPVKIK